MATTDAGAAAPSSAGPSPDDDDDKSCFICLQTATETPDAVWVTPCPCSIDAHEECMLQWISGMEATAPSRGGRASAPKKIRCPVCNARIRTIDQRDALVDFGDRLVAAYKRTTPAMLGAIVSTMGVAGSSFYGFQSLAVVAGGAEAWEWLLRGMPDLTRGTSFDSLVDMAAGVTSFGAGGGGLGFGFGLLGEHAWWAFGVVNKMVFLNLLAPSLLLYRLLPSVANLVALPVSLIYGATLVSRNKWPTWPPSPVWAMVAMPTVSIAYSTLYYDLFGGLEKRLNRALLGRPEHDEPQELRAPQAVGGAVGGGGAGEANNDDNNGNNNNNNNGAVAADDGGFLAPLHRFRLFLAELAGQDDDDDHHDHDHDHGHDHNHNHGVEDIAIQVNNDDGFIQVAVDIAIEEIEVETDDDEVDENNENNENNINDDVNNIDDDEILPPRQVRDDDMNILGEVVDNDNQDNDNEDDDNDDAALPPPDIQRLRPAANIDADIAADQNGPAHVHPDVMQGPALAEALAGGPPADAAPPPPANGGGLFVSDIIAAVTTQLLLPQVAGAIGNLLFLTLPRSWVVPPAPEVPVAVAAISWWSLSTKTPTSTTAPRLPAGTVRRGLLMEKWGRSLVGGLLWIVLRDAWSLYIKYRRVQTKKQRKIKNVDRRRRRGDEETTETATTAA